MNQLDRVKICKRCSLRRFDMNKGILCSLTGEKATFQVNCSDYSIDDEAIIKEDKIDALNQKYHENFDESDLSVVPPELAVKSGANWFYWIAGLSFVNSLVILFEMDFGFIAGLGISQLVDGLIIGAYGEYNLISIIPSVLISIGFVLIGVYANKFSKTAFLVGMIIYGLDSFIFLMVSDFLSIGFHVFALFMIYKGFQNLPEMNTNKNSEVLDNENILNS